VKRCISSDQLPKQSGSVLARLGFKHRAADFGKCVVPAKQMVFGINHRESFRERIEGRLPLLRGFPSHVFRSPQPQERTDCRHQHTPIDWVCQISIGPAVERAHPVLARNERRRDLQHGDQGCPWVLLDPLAYFVAGNIRQVYVQDDQVWQCLCNFLGPESAAGLGAVKPRRVEGTTQNVAIFFAVVRDQDARHCTARHSFVQQRFKERVQPISPNPGMVAPIAACSRLPCE